MLENLSIYLSYKLTSSNLVEELHEYKLKKLWDIRVFPLVLRTTSKDLPFPSLLLLKKISSEATDAVKCAQNAGKISENVCLWKYFAGDTIFQTCTIITCITLACHRCQKTTGNSVLILQYCRENRETSLWLLSWTFGGWFNHQLSPAFRYMEISKRRGLTASFVDFANYSCQNFAI